MIKNQLKIIYKANNKSYNWAKLIIKYLKINIYIILAKNLLKIIYISNFLILFFNYLYLLNCLDFIFGYVNLIITIKKELL